MNPVEAVRPLTRHDLYERCVQSPRDMVAMLRAVHGGEPRALGEDFAGTAALSMAWVEMIDQGGDEARAIAVDLDAEALGYHGKHPRIERVVADVRTVDAACDVVFVGNFSIGFWHTRGELVGYLRHVRQRLGPGGVFECDTYGGESAFLTGHVHRDHVIADGPHAGSRVRYTWEQREADPLTGMVTDVCHFRVDRAGVIELELRDAFVYRWRLWSVPELRDAMVEAGFGRVEVYDKTPDAVDESGRAYLVPMGSGDVVDASFIVYVAARVS